MIIGLRLKMSVASFVLLTCSVRLACQHELLLFYLTLFTSADDYLVSDYGMSW
jgi:hypothetical protein